VFNGPQPQLEILSDSNQEIQTVGKWIKDCLDKGFQPYEIGIFVRETQQLKRAKRAIELAQANYVELDHKIIPTSDCIAVSTMHLAKGMEFRAVAVMACDDEVIPLQERIETVADEADLEEVYRTERHLLYVACTRARDRLLITGVDPASEFLEDIEI
jgi:N-acetylglutamate synthase-like GNAT family acetyltransferase